jgi:co-chaperonin GroES (HSP10)
MKVIHKNVLVAIPDKEKPGGVYIPEEEQDKVNRGEVVHIGSEVPQDVQELLKAEPQIEYKEYYDGAEITIDKKKYIVMTYDSILLIL